MAGLFGDDDPPPPQEGPGLFGAAPIPVSRTPGAPSPEPSASAPVAAPAGAVNYRVLARTWRPVTFDDLIGQDAMVRTLRRAFATGRVAHAFMLTGTRGIGKTTTARIIARCLNCTGPDGTGGPTADPCGVCLECRSILADRCPDVVELDAASNNGVDDVREVIEATRFAPMQARTKVFIVDEVHMLSRQAFNALLKTLEEPPPHVKFVFATTELRRVPITVQSRCQRFDLRRVSVADLSARFATIAAQEGVGIGADALAMIARAADGSVRDGLSLLDQAIAQHDGAGPIAPQAVADMLGLADRTIVFDLLEATLGGRLAELMAITGRAHELGASWPLVIGDLLELLHNVTRLQAVPELRDSHELPEAERMRGAALADRVSLPELARAWQMLLKGLAEVNTAPDQHAAAEMVLIRLCHLADTPTPGELVRRLRDAPPSATHATPGEAAPLPPPPPSPPPPPPLARAVGQSPIAVAVAAPAPATAPAPGSVPASMPSQGPRLASLRDIAAAVSSNRHLAQLHAHLVHSVHLVRLAPPLLELRCQPDAPRNLAAQLAGFLQELTHQRWTIVISAAQGEPTLAEQAATAAEARADDALAHPLVQAILATFPGARLSPVHDSGVDAYGLANDSEVELGGSAEAIDLTGETAPDIPFAPEHSEPAGRPD